MILMANLVQTQISVIIPTYNRPYKLQRALRYYAKNGIPVLIADGSPSPCTLPLEGNISYFHLPDPTLIERVSQVVNMITTPYACLAADDDFVSPSFLKNACNIMETDTSVGTVFGKCYAFEEKAPHKWRETYAYARSADQESFKERLSSLFGNYYPLIYAPTRTDLLKETFDSLPRLPLKYANMMELLHGVRLAVAGKIVILDDFYLARERAEVYLTGLLYPSVQVILSEMPSLYDTANSLLAKWAGSQEKELFTKYVMGPYNECCSRKHKPSWMSKTKIASRRILGDERTESLKKVLPFLVSKPSINAASDFACSEALLEIEQFVMRSLEDEAQAKMEGENQNASS